MKIGVITFLGSNCDNDIIEIFRNELKQEVVNLWHKNTDIQQCDLVVLPGGFSYGDYLRSGALANFSPIMESVKEFAKNGGFVLGICNGFQILCESGLLPGTLYHNDNHRYICKNVYIKLNIENNKFGKNQDEEIFKIPIAHGEGKYYDSPENIELLEQNDQIIFQYCDENGNINGNSNPNGTIMNIAGISNFEKNIYGMMPHPERCADIDLGNTDGKRLLERFLENIESKIKISN